VLAGKLVIAPGAGQRFAQGKEKDGTRTAWQTSAARELDERSLELDSARQPLACLESKTDLLQRQIGHHYEARITSICWPESA